MKTSESKTLSCLRKISHSSQPVSLWAHTALSKPQPVKRTFLQQCERVLSIPLLPNTARAQTLYLPVCELCVCRTREIYSSCTRTRQAHAGVQGLYICALVCELCTHHRLPLCEVACGLQRLQSGRFHLPQLSLPPLIPSPSHTSKPRARSPGCAQVPNRCNLARGGGGCCV